METYKNRRDYLVAVFEDSMRVINGDEVLTTAVRQSVRGQRFVAEDEAVVVPEPRFADKAQVLVTKNRSFEAAVSYATRGLKTAVLNFASASHPGGGVEHGASAQEEGLCRVSTLYPCLKDGRMWQKFYAPHRLSRNPLHNDDIIYTPDVLVFKDDDYSPLSPFVAVDVITCAAPNLMAASSCFDNQHTGSAVQLSDSELLALHEKRGRKILSVAAANGVDVVILGAFGCGAFSNNPYVVAQAYKNILSEYALFFRTIEFAVYCRPDNDENYSAFSRTLAAEL